MTSNDTAKKITKRLLTVFALWLLIPIAMESFGASGPSTAIAFGIGWACCCIYGIFAMVKVNS